MAYLTTNEYQDLYPSDASDLSSIGDTELAIAYAEEEANSYVGVLYSLPLATVPLVLKNKVADIARYQLDQFAAREDVRQRYEDAISWLKGVAAGKISLGIDSDGDQVDSPSLDVHYTSNEQIFSDVAMGGFL